jgi:TolA-binding protein
LRDVLHNPKSADDFDRDAAEGWSLQGFDFQKMESLDKKFGFAIPRWSYLLLFILFGSLTLMGYLYLDQDSTITKTGIVKETVKTEKTDVYLPEKFDTLTENTIRNKEDAVQISETQRKKATQPISDINQIVELPISLLPISPARTLEKERPISIKRRGKEIYLQDFKLLDYSIIRKQSAIQSEQLIPQGTRANMESNDQTYPSVEIWREENVPYMDYLDKSMYFLKMGSFKNALNRFETILQKYPEDLNAQFYSAFAYYSLGQFNLASTFFVQSIQNSYINFDEESLWYCGLCLEKLNDPKATEIFKTIANSTSYYAIYATEKL